MLKLILKKSLVMFNQSCIQSEGHMTQSFPSQESRTIAGYWTNTNTQGPRAQRFSDINVHTNYLGTLSKADLDTMGLERGPRLCISNRLSHDVDALVWDHI